MGRIFFWVIVGILFWFAWRLLMRNGRDIGKPDDVEKRSSGPNGDSAPPQQPPASRDQIPMLQCAYCGIHFPATDAVRAEDGRVYCTPSHDRLAHHPGEA